MGFQPLLWRIRHEMLVGKQFGAVHGFPHDENQPSKTIFCSIAHISFKAGLVDAAEQYPYGYTYLAKKKAQGLKAQIFVGPQRPD